MAGLHSFIFWSLYSGLSKRPVPGVPLICRIEGAARRRANCTRFGWLLKREYRAVSQESIRHNRDRHTDPPMVCILNVAELCRLNEICVNSMARAEVSRNGCVHV